jgi:hypothetical protein
MDVVCVYQCLYVCVHGFCCSCPICSAFCIVLLFVVKCFACVCICPICSAFCNVWLFVVAMSSFVLLVQMTVCRRVARERNCSEVPVHNTSSSHISSTHAFTNARGVWGASPLTIVGPITKWYCIQKHVAQQGGLGAQAIKPLDPIAKRSTIFFAMLFSSCQPSD